VTFQAPPGLKQNLARNYAAWSPEWLARGGPLRAQLLFLLAWLHALVQERRSYVPQAWTQPYEFSAADLRTGFDIVGRLGAGAGVGWAGLRGLLLDAVYGGRVDNACDARVRCCCFLVA